MPRLRNLTRNILTFRSQSYVVRERHFQFDPSVLDLPDGVYLDGYWQSPRYFSDVQPVIRGAFSFDRKVSEQNRALAARISDADSVSIHVRRGDYTSVRSLNYHGVCSMEYYRSAVRTMASKIRNPVFYVFSDDPAWVKENCSFCRPMIVVEHPGQEQAYTDMWLMSLCKHHIIANSSFSWWAAWLSANPEKIVIAPRQWFRDPNIKTDDLIPAAWLRLDSL